MDDGTILFEVDDAGVATVTLNRPARLNSLTDAMVARLAETLEDAATDERVRVIVLTGAGRAFCAGADVGGLGEQTPREILGKLRRPFDHSRAAGFQTRHTYFPAIPKPIIAMVNGPAAGLGLLYALASDVRFASEEAVFTTGLARLGLGTEYGVGWLLRQAVGHANALELLLSSRKVKGEEVARLGLANFVVPAAELAARTSAYAREMAQGCSPQSFAYMKRQVWGMATQSLADSVIETNRDMLATNASPDYAEGVAAFREKRPPRFPPLSQDGLFGL